ncbi:hypothetical protein BVRB_3g067130 [Beta vulgaris subsp. vulgaris]|uniref:uncharacterized protein LOC104906527 n=1 Tax=Beta vulgaris subsp. vulgaris TaxID=3555 RepID=UPI00065C4F80|nr:uncharacterized protein LOC104906527 [Beta vulgaris subsp. vulgaris]KMS98975.1 hypothetical protein BVRB_3g067130 [Beta vulgaris subsp. vulgaris]
MATSDGIKHRSLHVNGINMHVVEKGDEGSPVVLFIHGFPELWYSWRHQILSLSALGYRAVAPDMRGYGDTEAPSDARKYTYVHIVGDLVALIDELGVDQVFVVGHDWGAVIGWWLCLFRPDRVKAFVSMSVAFSPRNPNMKLLDMLCAAYGPDYYICRFQVPGEIESEIAEAGGADKLLRKIFSFRDPGPLMLPKGKAFTDMASYPNWLSQEESSYYVDKFTKSGFTGGLNYYRALNLNWELTAPWTGAQVEVPVKFVVGDLDLAYHMPGVKEYINQGGMKKDVPLLEEVVILEGVAHFLQQEKPDVVTDHIYDFIRKF